VWDFDTHTEVMRLQGHDSTVQGVAVLPGGRQAVSVAGNDLRIWDLKTGKSVKQLTLNAAGCMQLVLSKDGRFLALASYANLVHVVDLVELKQVAATNFSPNIQWIAFSPDGQYLAVVLGPWDRFVYIHDARDLSKVAQIEGPPDLPDGKKVRMLTVAFTPNGQHLLASTTNQQMLVWPILGKGAEK
jgi:WD40 repeat protein